MFVKVLIQKFCNIVLDIGEQVRVFTHMVSCHHEEALKYKFKHKRANKSLSDVDRVAQWLKQHGSGTFHPTDISPRFEK